ncbi:MAG: hypothetical protein FWE13_00075 [Firmicutes bacterium]|nr:hypothetical protein [Bacillota bacterium]
MNTTIKVSELLGKPVITLNNAETLGTAANIVFDNKMQTAKALKCLQSDNENEAEAFYIDIKRIKDLSLDALTISNKSLAKPEGTNNLLRARNPINTFCYNQDGKLLGIVKDVLLESLRVTEISISQTETNNLFILTPATLISHSKENLIFNDTGRPIKIPSQKKPSFPKRKPTSNAPVAKLHTITNPTVAIDTQSKTTYSIEKEADKQLIPLDIHTPTKIPTENTQVYRSPAPIDALASIYAFLIGKTLSRSIKDNNNNIIAKPQSIITQETIELVKTNQKLVQLALYAD